MAFVRRSTERDAVWARAWTADAVSDLASISAQLEPFRPKHGDIAFVTADSQYWQWFDDDSWHPLPITLVGQYPFPATQNPSSDPNILDDYEEGTWTPTLGGSGGESGQTYSIQSGRYVKIGKWVWVTGRITLSNLGTITGNAQIKGFPFTCVNSSNTLWVFTVGWATLNTNWVSILLGIISNTTTGNLVGANAAATSNATTSLVQADFTNTSLLAFTGFYEATD